MLSTTVKPYSGDLILKGIDKNYNISYSFCHYQFIRDNCTMESYLHIEEIKRYNNFRYDKRKKSYLLGRYAAKEALCHHTGKNNPNNIIIQQGVFGQPMILSNQLHNLHVSITHCDEVGGAIIFPEDCPVGMDIENIQKVSESSFLFQVTESEGRLIHHPYGYNPSTIMALIWSAKECLSKILRTGLTVPFELLEISKIIYKDRYFISYFKNFIQYCTYSICCGEYILSITCPTNTELLRMEELLEIVTLNRIET